VKAGDFDAQNISNSLNAMAKLDHYDKTVMDKLLSEVIVKAGDFNAQNISISLNAMAKLDHYDKTSVDKLLSEVLVKIGDFGVQNSSNSLLALVMLQHYTKPVFLVLLNSLNHILPTRVTLSREARNQCWQILLALYLEQPGWNLHNPIWKSDVAEEWSLSLASTSSSRLHKQVSRALTRMQIAHTNEHQLGELSVDIFIPDCPHRITTETAAVDKGRVMGAAAPLTRGQQTLGTGGVAVEVDGPSHFCRNDLQRELGATLFKRRMLAKQGWRLVCVPYFEWVSLAPHQQPSYLQTKLGLPLEK
jgi:hypothetical protein